MNNNFSQVFQLNNSGLGCFLTLILMGILLTSIGLGWIVNSVLVLFAILLITPVIAFWLIRWWVQRNVIEDQCPVCNYEFTGFNRSNFRCPSCGEELKVEDGKFQRITPPGTIDVDAVEVAVRQIED